MKQLLAVVLCVILVGMKAGSACAETGTGGYMGYKYRLLDGSDDAFVVLNFNGQVNDKAVAYFSLIFSGVDREFKSDSFYVIYKEKYGTFTIGRFSYGAGNLYILGSAFSGLISNIGIKFDYPCLEVLTFKFGYFHEEENESFYDYDSDLSDPNNPLTRYYYDAFTIGCDYRFEKVFIGLNYIHPGYNNPYKYIPAGYTLNASVDLNPGSKIYLHYGQDQDSNRKGVTGYYTGFSSKIPLVIGAECGFIPDAGNNVDYGCSLKYEISKKSVLSYLFAGNGATTKSSELMMTFFF